MKTVARGAEQARRRARRPGRGCRRSRPPRRGPLLVGQPGDPGVGAAHLVRAGPLQVLALEPGRPAELRGQRPARLERRTPDHPVEKVPGGLDVGKGDQVWVDVMLRSCHPARPPEALWSAHLRRRRAARPARHRQDHRPVGRHRPQGPGIRYGGSSAQPRDLRVLRAGDLGDHDDREGGGQDEQRRGRKAQRDLPPEEVQGERLFDRLAGQHRRSDAGQFAGVVQAGDHADDDRAERRHKPRPPGPHQDRQVAPAAPGPAPPDALHREVGDLQRRQDQVGHRDEPDTDRDPVLTPRRTPRQPLVQHGDVGPRLCRPGQERDHREDEQDGDGAVDHGRDDARPLRGGRAPVQRPRVEQGLERVEQVRGGAAGDREHRGGGPAGDRAYVRRRPAPLTRRRSRCRSR